MPLVAVRRLAVARPGGGAVEFFHPPGRGPTALTSYCWGLTGRAGQCARQCAVVQLVLWLTLLSGAVQMLLGLARMGWLLRVGDVASAHRFHPGCRVADFATQLPALLACKYCGRLA